MIKLMLRSILVFFCISSVYAAMRDPTRPANYLDKETSEIHAGAFVLALTLVSPDHNIVVINDTPLHIGDTVGGNRIVAIASDSVQLAGPSGNITLFLLDKPVKQAVQNKS